MVDCAEDDGCDDELMEGMGDGMRDVWGVVRWYFRCDSPRSSLSCVGAGTDLSLSHI